MNTGIPTMPLMATGRVGPDQIAQAEKLLVGAKAEGLIRVVLIHHPPYVGGARRTRELLDADAFEAMLRRAGAELVLHGHNHRFSLAWRPGLDHDVPIVGVPSASIGLRGGHGGFACWHLCVSRAAGGPGHQPGAPCLRSRRHGQAVAAGAADRRRDGLSP